MTRNLSREVHIPDFSIAYTQSLVLREGHNPYTADITPFAERLGLDVHPIKHAVDAPSMLLLFEPITLFTPEKGYWIWFTINVGLLLGAMAMLLKRGGYDAPEFWIGAALILLYPPVWCNFLWAQTQVLVLFLLTLAVTRVRRGDDASAAALVAIAGCLRIYPFAALGFFLIKRKWTALASAAIVVGAITGFTVAIVGVDPYLTYVRGLSYTLSVTVGNASFAAFTTRLIAEPRLVRLLTTGADAAILYLAVRTTARSDGVRAFMLWIVTAVALSPIVWIHYFVLLLIPFSEMLFDPYQHRTTAGMIAGVANYLVLVLAVANTGAAAKGPPTAIDLLILRDGQFAALALGFIATYIFCSRSERVPRMPKAEDAARALSA